MKEVLGSSVAELPVRPAAGLHRRTPLDVADILNAAADLLAAPGAWVKGNYSLDDEGRSPDETSSDYEVYFPVCYCAIGAINCAAGRPTDDVTDHPAMLAFGIFIGTPEIHEWNDAEGRTQAEVVAALREAAALSRGAPTGSPSEASASALSTDELNTSPQKDITHDH